MATHDTIYFNVVRKDGTALSKGPLQAGFDESLGAWVDTERGIVIEFLGLILGPDTIYSSHAEQDVEEWVDSEQGKRKAE